MKPKTNATFTRREFVAFGALAALSTFPGCTQNPALGGLKNEGATTSTIPVFKDEAAKARYFALYDAVLQDWAVPHESIYCSTRYGATHVVACGPLSAPPVILLPALLATATSWRPNIAALSKHFRCYAIDVIGEVNKSEPTRPLKNKMDCSNWLTDVMNALKLNKASMVGASLGGFFALNQAVLHPARVERLVLISPANTLPMATMKFVYYVGLAAMGNEKPFDEWMGAGIPWNPADNSSGALWAAKNEARGMINNLSLGDVSDAEWRTVRAPTLLLIGDREVIYNDPPEQTLRLAKERILGLRGEIVPNANHLAARANPEFVNERITAFLQETMVR